MISILVDPAADPTPPTPPPLSFFPAWKLLQGLAGGLAYIAVWHRHGNGHGF